jgi:hypothetical protein
VLYVIEAEPHTRAVRVKTEDQEDKIGEIGQTIVAAIMYAWQEAGIESLQRMSGSRK